MLTYIAEMSSRQKTNGNKKSGSTLEQQLCHAGILMEAFGNAKTLHNHNSSRFSELISLKFDGAGAIIGGQFSCYLLETNRVHTHKKGESNYHVFYQLLAAGAKVFDGRSKQQGKDAHQDAKDEAALPHTPLTAAMNSPGDYYSFLLCM